MLEKFLTALVNSGYRTTFIRELKVYDAYEIHSFRIQSDEAQLHCHVIIEGEHIQLMFEFSEINYSFEKDNLRHQIIDVKDNIPK